MEKINCLILIFLLAAIVWINGCATQKPDPLAAWKPLFGREYEMVDKATKDDYQNYIQKLPSRKNEFAMSPHLFEEGTGQHAVDINTGANGRWWRHILIYDKDNKRIKVFEYKTGYYRS